MIRTRTVLVLTTAVLTLTACAAEPVAEISQVDDAVADEASALEEVGLATGLAAPSAPADTERRRVTARHLKRNTLHGEIVVQGRDGQVRTVVVQRGSVTAVDGRAVTVTSADGWTLTWTLAPDVRVRQDRKKADAAAVTTGAQVGVAGAKTGDTATARLVIVT